MTKIQFDAFAVTMFRSSLANVPSGAAARTSARRLGLMSKNNSLTIDRRYNTEATIKIEKEYKYHRLPGVDLAREVTVTAAELLEHYTEMFLMRRLEVAADQLYKQRQIRGFLHLYSGQEAVASGFESILTREDSVITAYRDHCFLITKRCGGNVEEVISELCGRATGCSRGKGGSMHLYKVGGNFYGGHGIVGAQIPLGTGLAFAHKYSKSRNVCFTYMGDGAVNQGQVYEALNMAAMWKLPCIYVVENNGYAMGTPVVRSSATNELYTRGDYVPGIQVDGMNLLAVKECGKFAVEWARSGNGPLWIEALTYRYSGHSMSDPGTSYRTRQEISDVREKNDPIDRVKGWILSNNLASEQDLAEIERAAKKRVEQAVQYALSSPEPAPEDLYQDVYVEPVPVRGISLS